MNELDRVRRALEAVAEADHHLQLATERHRAMTLDTARLLEKENAELIEVLVEVHAAERRQEVNEAIEAFESARHGVRLAFFALGRAQGATVASVGRALGISRQLASRLANLPDQPGS